MGMPHPRPSRLRIERSSGNVFREVGFPPAEAENLRVRAQLMVEIEKYVRAKGLTQKAAAKQFGITQPQMTNLMRGKISLFSVDTLISMLTHAGLRVNVKVRRFAAWGSTARPDCEATGTTSLVLHGGSLEASLRRHQLEKALRGAGTHEVLRRRTN